MENEKRRGPILNTREIDLAYYDELRKLFMADYLRFRRGNLSAYSSALNNLIAMYSTLPSARHYAKTKEESIAFLKSIDDFNSELDDYSKTGVKYPTQAHIHRIDELYRKFMTIMYDLGYTT